MVISGRLIVHRHQEREWRRQQAQVQGDNTYNEASSDESEPEEHTMDEEEQQYGCVSI